MNSQCIKCGRTITHHHKYCDLCYPKKTATIQQLKNENRKYKRLLETVLNPSVNKNSYVTKKQIRSLIKKYKLKDVKDI